MQKEIVAIKSVGFGYFEIGKNEFGYYLKNKYTDIPNEFKMYSLERVKKMFIDLCEGLSECIKIEFPCERQGFKVRVIYSDKTEQLFQSVESERAYPFVFAYIYAENYVEFYTESPVYFIPTLLTLDHLRKVCREKVEEYDVLLSIIKELYEDDYVDVVEYNLPDGTTEIHQIVMGQDYHGALVTIAPDGKIQGTSIFKFVELMKNNEVIVHKKTR